MKLVVGLGNPGKKYEHTRHNIGWRAVEHLSLHLDAGTPTKNAKFKAAVAETQVEGEKVLLVLPQTFMNLSGEAVQSLASFYKIPPEHILIVHDEMDFTLGRLQFSIGGGDAGHNGVKSIMEMLGTPDFARLRIGIGRPQPPKAKEDHVLERFTEEQAAQVDLVVEKTDEAIYDWITKGLTSAMNTWNGVEA